MWRAVLAAIGIAGGSARSTPTYRAPPGWCTNHSDMWATTILTNGPPVVAIGDGAGIDYFVAGMEHYAAWLTNDGGSQRLKLLSTAEPRTITQSGMSPLGIACVHVQASDRVQNASAEEVTCSRALATP